MIDERLDQIVNNDRLRQFSSQMMQILDVHFWAILLLLYSAVVTIETIFDVFFGIYLINDPVCIFLHRCCKNHNLIMLGQGLQKLITARPNCKKIFFFIEMDQSLIQV